MLDYIKTTLPRAPLLGPPLYETLHGIKKGIKDVLQPQVLFEDLGLKYVGPDRRPRRGGWWSTRCAGPATSAGRCSCT